MINKKKRKPCKHLKTKQKQLSVRESAKLNEGKITSTLVENMQRKRTRQAAHCYCCSTTRTIYDSVEQRRNKKNCKKVLAQNEKKKTI